MSAFEGMPLPDLMRNIRFAGPDDLDAAQIIIAWLRANPTVVWELLRQTEGISSTGDQG